MVLNDPHIMRESTKELAGIELNVEERVLKIHYTPKTERAMFDICDVEGRIILTGQLSQSPAVIELTENFQLGNSYVIWVVDGSEMSKSRFAFK